MDKVDPDGCDEVLSSASWLQSVIQLIKFYDQFYVDCNKGKQIKLIAD